MSHANEDKVGYQVNLDMHSPADNYNFNGKDIVSQDTDSRSSDTENQSFQSDIELKSQSPNNLKTSVEETRIVLLPLSVTVDHFKILLSPFELKEILSWPDIYFAGSAADQKVSTSKRPTGAHMHNVYNLPRTNFDKDKQSYNFGFDDSHGDLYLARNDHICYRYEILSLLGKGSFGQVVKCFDHKRQIYVAMKIIRNKKRFAKQGLIEADILKKLAACDQGVYNTVHLLDQYNFRGHLCFAFEVLGTNLYDWIKAGSFRGVHLGALRQISKQILQCLVLLKSMNIIHCDLKPEVYYFNQNILMRDINNTKPQNDCLKPLLSSTKETIPTIDREVSYDNSVKVIDFGSSCYESEQIFTYIQSRFYRAPEVILGLPVSTAIDMWSLGCLLSELYTGIPLFPGEDENEQLACIMEVKGIPNPSYLKNATRSRKFIGI